MGRHHRGDPILGQLAIASVAHARRQPGPERWVDSRARRRESSFFGVVGPSDENLGGSGGLAWVSDLGRCGGTTQGCEHSYDLAEMKSFHNWCSGGTRADFGVGESRSTFPRLQLSREEGPRSRADQVSLRARRVEPRQPQPITPSCLPILVKAAIARSMCSLECAADSCTRIRAWPCGTTGYEKPIT